MYGLCNFEVCNEVCNQKCINMQKICKTDAILRLVMLTSRANSLGFYPIVLRVQWKGRKEKYSGISVPKDYWDKDKEQIIIPKKVRQIDALDKELVFAYNEKLRKLKDSALKVLRHYKLTNQPFTAEMLLKPLQIPSKTIVSYSKTAEKLR